MAKKKILYNTWQSFPGIFLPYYIDGFFLYTEEQSDNVRTSDVMTLDLEKGSKSNFELNEY